MTHPMQAMSAPEVSREVQPLKQRLVNERVRLMDRVAQIDELLELINKNPDFEQFHNLLLKTSGY